MKTPFGATPAAIKLAQIVDQDRKARQYVGSVLSEMNGLLIQLAVVKNMRVRLDLYRRLRPSFLSQIESSAQSAEVKSFLKNVVNTTFKMFIRHANRFLEPNPNYKG